MNSKKTSAKCGRSSPGKIFDGAVVVDTHAIVWYLANDIRLSPGAAEAMDLATTAGDAIHVPSICLVELTYLVEKGRLPPIARERLIRALDDPGTPCRLAPLDRAVADALESIDRADVPDLPDRVVTATAIALQVPLISRDGKIRSSTVQTIW
jgi:PIN domain nuclease of toxin-antitoxin system